MARVLSRPVAELSQTPLEKPQILKGHEVEKGRYVTFEPQELAALRPRTSTELEIVEFVRVAEIDPVFFDVSYYVAPDKGGEKAYAVLFQALTETAYAAMASLAMHGREHAAVIRPGKRGLILHTLFYVNEVHAEEEYRTAVDVAKPQEIEMAKAFVGALASPFEAARLKDTLEERLRQLIQTRDRTAYAGTMRREPLNRAPVVDITEALRKSLERLVKKPLQSEVAAPARKKMGRRAKR